MLIYSHFGGGTVQKKIRISTDRRQSLVDITGEVENFVKESGVVNGLATVYAQGATASIMIQENWDDSVQQDVINFLSQIIPQGVWLHDQQDGNGDAHLKAGIVGPSEVVPISGGKLALSQWQNIFFCEFDGPRQQRTILCTVISV